MQTTISYELAKRLADKGFAEESYCPSRLVHYDSKPPAEAAGLLLEWCIDRGHVKVEEKE